MSGPGSWIGVEDVDMSGTRSDLGSRYDARSSLEQLWHRGGGCIRPLGLGAITYVVFFGRGHLQHNFPAFLMVIGDQGHDVGCSGG